MQAETIVNALTQNTARLSLTLEDDHIPNTIFPCRNSCSKTGRAAANNDQILLNHTPAASFPMAS